MKIYVASSWRNDTQPEVVKLLRSAGHEVYDFRNPVAGDRGFSWSAIDPNWRSWTPAQLVEALQHPIARRNFAFDMNALRDADACVFVQPCGVSASLELGFAVGQSKRTVVLLQAGPRFEPELMFSMVDRIVTDIAHVLPALVAP